MRIPLIKSLLAIGIINPIEMAKRGQLLVNGSRCDFIDNNTMIFLSDTVYLHGAPFLLDKKFALKSN